MVLRDVPREEWDTFLNTFSRRHRNEPVTLEKSDVQDGLKIAAQAVPLMAVTHERGPERISVTIGDVPSGHVTHTIAEADGVAVEEPAEADEDPRLAIHFTGAGQHVVLRLAKIPD